jgi:hypothetical protein
MLQETWNKYPDLTQWMFRALAKVTGKRQANIREAELILEVPEERRLNTKMTSTVTVERWRQVKEMLDRGCKYREIGRAVGISIGMISKIKTALRQKEVEC